MHKEDSIRERLDALAELCCKRDALQCRQREEEEAAIPKEVSDRLLGIRAVYSLQLAELGDDIARLEREIKDETIAWGDSVPAERMTAVFSNPRVTWETKRLDRLSQECPDTGQPCISIRKCRKVGQPSASIRKR